MLLMAREMCIEISRMLPLVKYNSCKVMNLAKFY